MKLRDRLCVLFGALALNACASIHLGAENETDVRVLDLKTSGAGPFGWVDNETFVIMANTGERYSRKDGAEVLVARVTTLNYKTGERRTFGKVSSGLCHSPDGYVSYIFADGAKDELWASYGKLGEETTRKIKPGEIAFDRGGSCRPWSEDVHIATPAWAEGKTDVLRLWPRLGLISCNVRPYSVATRHINASYHKSGAESGIELPFSCNHVRRGFTYYPFKGAYFTPEQAHMTPWPAGSDRKSYWLYPDGKVETLVLPYSSAIRENMVPTKRGIIAFGRPATRQEDYGVYLVTPQATKRILRGHAAGVTSPDGCKVAILHDPEYDARLDRRPVSEPVTLKILELC